MSLYSKRLESGRFIWPSPVGGAAAMGGVHMLEGIDWRNPRDAFRPQRAG